MIYLIEVDKMKKKFQSISRTKMVIIPKTWIDAEERKTGKKMVGVDLEMLDGEIKLVPMWESEYVYARFTLPGMKKSS